MLVSIFSTNININRGQLRIQLTFDRRFFSIFYSYLKPRVSTKWKRKRIQGRCLRLFADSLWRANEKRLIEGYSTVPSFYLLHAHTFEVVYPPSNFLLRHNTNRWPQNETDWWNGRENNNNDKSTNNIFRAQCAWRSAHASGGVDTLGKYNFSLKVLLYQPYVGLFFL